MDVLHMGGENVLDIYTKIRESSGIARTLAILAAVWLFIQNFWIIIILAFLWFMSQRKKDNKSPKHLPTTDGVVQMIFELYK